MLPVLLRISLDTPGGALLAYALALAVVLYLAYSSWRAASRAGAPPRERWLGAAKMGAVGLVLSRIALYFALPATRFLGGRGEGIPLHSYGVLVGGGFLAAVALSAHLAEREWRGEEGRRKRDQVYDLAFWVFLSGVGGAKLLFILVNLGDYGWDSFTSLSKLGELLGGGFVFYGGLIGASAASFFYARAHKFDFFRLADLAIPTVSLGQCLGRLGCFCAGCCWGDVARAQLPWGIHFPGAQAAKGLWGQATSAASLAYQSQVTDPRWVVESTGQVLPHAVPGALKISSWVASHGHTLPLHPTQLYESLGQLVLFGGLMLLRRYRRFHGQIFALWLMAYAVLRSTVELFRGDLERGTLHGLLKQLGGLELADKVPAEAWYNLSTSQFISLCMFAFGAALLYRKGGAAVFRAPTPASAPAAG